MPEMKLNRKPFSEQPVNPYDTEAWTAFYEANPGFRRSVGAEGVNDQGGSEEEAAKAAEEKAAAEAKAAEEAKAKEEGKSGKPSDKEAELLKDVMKQKEAGKALKQQLEDLSKQFEGVDLEEYREMKAKQAEAAEAAKKAEEERLLKEGDFEKVKEQMLTQHTEALTEVQTQLASKDEELAKAHKLIEELTIGSDFGSSKFISEATVFTPTKARRLYGDHFEVENGKVVAYDKPRGDDSRTKLVDASGNPVNFDAAMKRIIEADPEKDDILVAGLKPGSDSNPGRGKSEEKKTAPTTSRDKISSGVQDLMKNIGTASDGGVKL